MASPWLQFHATWRWEPRPAQRDLFGTVSRLGFVTLGLAGDLIATEEARGRARAALQAEIVAEARAALQALKP
jgi:hypothetical protein